MTRLLRAAIAPVAGAALLLASPSFAADPAAAPAAPASPALATEKDRVHYAIGFNIASNLKQQGVDVDLDLVIRGMRDALTGAEPLLSTEEIRIGIQKYQSQVRRMRSRNLAEEALENRFTSEAFLAANKTAAGVVSLPSGVQYQVLAAGAGPKPRQGQQVELKFRGTLRSGREFDASPHDGRTSSFRLADLLPGLREALALMPVGSKWKIFVPPALGYESRDRPAVVRPDSVLIYEVELVAVK